MKAGRYASARACFESVLRARPDWATAQFDLARTCFALGESERATRHLRASLRIRRDVRVLEFFAKVAPFDPRLGHAAVRNSRRAFGEAIRGKAILPGRQSVEAALPSRGKMRGASKGAKKLKVGYVSSFFEDDNWMKPVWGLIDHHDGALVEVHLISDESRPSAVRRRARASGARVHDITRLGNAAAAGRIARMGLDVLVDLNQYSRVGRLALFTARPAPVIVAWFNIFATSGLAAFDALIGDPWLIRDGEDRWFMESLVRLPLSSLTFEVSYRVPPVAPPPCARNGFVTFGSLGSLYKINDRVVEAWAEILKRSPRSRLVVGNAFLGEPGNREHLLARFAARGIGGERITLLGPARHYDFLRNYAAMDVALDTFPYNGGTTTTEAIWQGVPVIAFSGDRWIARTSASLLENAGLGRCVARDVRGYVEAAVRWGSAAKAQERRRLRLSMRARLKASSVTDCARLARSMEKVYRELSDRRADRRAASPSKA